MHIIKIINSMTIDIMKIADPSVVLNIVNKYPDFVTEQSNDITMDFACFAQRQVSRCDAVFEIDKYIRNIKISMEIEAGVFEFSLLYVFSKNLLKQFVGSVYEHKIYDLTRNMMQNKEIVSDIKTNTVKPYVVAFMTPSQLYPQKWEVLLAKKHLREEKENNLPTTDIYKCRKCDYRKTFISFMQTRSADEPMTTFVKCCNCYNTWTV